MDVFVCIAQEGTDRGNQTEALCRTERIDVSGKKERPHSILPSQNLSGITTTNSSRGDVRTNGRGRYTSVNVNTVTLLIMNFQDVREKNLQQKHESD